MTIRSGHDRRRREGKQTLAKQQSVLENLTRSRDPLARLPGKGLNRTLTTIARKKTFTSSRSGIEEKEKESRHWIKRRRQKALFQLLLLMEVYGDGSCGAVWKEYRVEEGSFLQRKRVRLR